MNKAKLVQVIKDSSGLNKKESKRIAENILHAIKMDLSRGVPIRFTGVMSLLPIVRKERWIKDIKTKKPILLPKTKDYRVYLSKHTSYLLNKMSILTGLDCYGYVRENNKKEEPKKFWYARKNRWIHNWILKKWNTLNPSIPMKGSELFLTEELLTELENTVNDGSIVNYNQTDYFTGSGKMTKEHKQEILNFVNQGKELLNQGKLVSYFSWW